MHWKLAEPRQLIVQCCNIANKIMRPLSLSLFQIQINQITLAQFPISGTDKLRPGIMLMRVISTIVISIPRTNPITAQKVKEQDERTTKR